MSRQDALREALRGAVVETLQDFAIDEFEPDDFRDAFMRRVDAILGPALLSGGGDAQDAARYRWLRSPDSGDAGTLVATLWNETLDAAIDREIAAMPTTPEASK